MSSKNVDAPRRPDTKKREKKSDAVDVPKSGPNRHPKLTAKKSAKSRYDDLRESGAYTIPRSLHIPRTGMSARTGSAGRK